MTKKLKSYYPKKNQVTVNWVQIDATQEVLGRLASRIARIVMGKEKAEYTKAVNDGDFVVVTNVSKIVVTGNKGKQKKYYTHSGQPGKLKEKTYDMLLPVKALMLAVKGMLPKNSLGRQMLKKVRLVEGETHPYSAQKPVAIAQ